MIRKGYAEHILNLPAKKRASVLKRTGKSFSPRPPFSADDIVKYVKDNEIRSYGTLVRLHREDQNRPNIYDVKKHFPKWSVLMVKCWPGSKHATAKPEMNPRYIAQAFVAYDIQNYRHFLKVKRRVGNLFPGYHDILREFGSFSNLMKFLDSFSSKKIFKSYVVLSLALNRFPTITESRKNGIDLESLLNKINSTKQELDAMIITAEPGIVTSFGKA